VNSVNKLIRENQEKWIRAKVMLDRPKTKKGIGKPKKRPKKYKVMKYNKILKRFAN